MKIIYCLNSLDVLGGIERVSIIKANKLAEMGHEVSIIVTDHRDNAIFVEPLSTKIKFINLNVGHWFGEKKWHSSITKLFKHYVRLKKYIKEYKPDIIISVGQSEKQIIALLRTQAIKIREIHFLSSYRKLTYNNKFLAKLLDFIDFKLTIHGYDQYILLTHEDYNDIYIGDKNKTSVIANPLTINPIVSNLNNKIVTCVCRLNDHQKNLIEMIDGFKIVIEKHPDWILKIWGKGPDQERIQNYINQLNLQNNIILAGYTNNVPLAMSEASIYIYTSKFEGFGLCLLEAMACGLPIVTYQFPVGAKDILDNSSAGFLVPIHNKTVLVEKICHLIENIELRKQMSDNAIKRANDFRIENIMNQWINLFKKLITKKSC